LEWVLGLAWAPESALELVSALAWGWASVLAWGSVSVSELASG
jgi:hypothetical protein